MYGLMFGTAPKFSGNTLPTAARHITTEPNLCRGSKTEVAPQFGLANLVAPKPSVRSNRALDITA